MFYSLIGTSSERQASAPSAWHVTLIRERPLRSLDRSLDPDAKITKMKDGRTHLAHKADHTVDLETGAIVAVTVVFPHGLFEAAERRVERVVGQPQRSLENPRFSPDGRLVVVASRLRDDEATDLGLHDLQTGTASRLTSHGGRAALWTDNGIAARPRHRAGPCRLW